MKLNTKPLAGIEIGFPVIADGVYHARIEKVEVKPNKTGDGNNLVVNFKVLDPTVCLHKDGAEITNKGQINMIRYFSLKPTPDYDPDKAMKELAVAIKADPEVDLNDSDLKDKIVNISVTYKPEEKDEKSGKSYPEGNNVSRVTPLKDDDTFTAPPF